MPVRQIEWTDYRFPGLLWVAERWTHESNLFGILKANLIWWFSQLYWKLKICHNWCISSLNHKPNICEGEKHIIQLCCRLKVAATKVGARLHYLPVRCGSYKNVTASQKWLPAKSSCQPKGSNSQNWLPSRSGCQPKMADSKKGAVSQQWLKDKKGEP